MEQNEINVILSSIANSLKNTESSVGKIASENENIEERLNQVEKRMSINDSEMKRFWERDWHDMVNGIKALNEKMDGHLTSQHQDRLSSSLTKQRLDTLERTHKEKIDKIEKAQEESSIAVWKMVGASASSGGVVAVLIGLIDHLLNQAA